MPITDAFFSRKGLKPEEVNLLVQLVHAGKTWEQATAQLKGVDLPSIQGWRDEIARRAAQVGKRRMPPAERR